MGAIYSKSDQTNANLNAAALSSAYHNQLNTQTHPTRLDLNNFNYNRNLPNPNLNTANYNVASLSRARDRTNDEINYRYLTEGHAFPQSVSVSPNQLLKTQYKSSPNYLLNTGRSVQHLNLQHLNTVKTESLANSPALLQSKVNLNPSNYQLNSQQQQQQLHSSNLSSNNSGFINVNNKRPHLIQQPPSKRARLTNDFMNIPHQQTLNIPLNANASSIGQRISSSPQSNQTGINRQHLPLNVGSLAGNSQRFVREPSYYPQVEAISPVPEDLRHGEIKAYNEKEDIGEKLRNVESEIRKLEQFVTGLLDRKNQMNQKLHSTNLQRLEDDTYTPTPRDPIQSVISENHRRALEQHQKFEKICGKEISWSPLALPLYRQPSDLECLTKISTHFNSTFKPLLIKYIRHRKTAEKARLEYLARNYEQLAKNWHKRIEKSQNSFKRKQKENKYREIFEKVFPEIRRTREEREKESFDFNDGSNYNYDGPYNNGSGSSNGSSCNLGQNNNGSSVYGNGNGSGANTRSSINITSGVNNCHNNGDNQRANSPYDPAKELERMRGYAIDPPIPLASWNRHWLTNQTTGRRITDAKTQHNNHQDYKNNWSREEMAVFSEQYVTTPKNFTRIARFLPKKSVSQCVQYYYLTKKNNKYKFLVKKNNRRRRAAANVERQQRIRTETENSNSGHTSNSTATAPSTSLASATTQSDVVGSSVGTTTTTLSSTTTIEHNPELACIIPASTTNTSSTESTTTTTATTNTTSTIESSIVVDNNNIKFTSDDTSCAVQHNNNQKYKKQHREDSDSDEEFSNNSGRAIGTSSVSCNKSPANSSTSTNNNNTNCDSNNKTNNSSVYDKSKSTDTKKSDQLESGSSIHITDAIQYSIEQNLSDTQFAPKMSVIQSLLGPGKSTVEQNSHQKLSFDGNSINKSPHNLLMVHSLANSGYVDQHKPVNSSTNSLVNGFDNSHKPINNGLSSINSLQDPTNANLSSSLFNRAILMKDFCTAQMMNHISQNNNSNTGLNNTTTTNSVHFNVDKNRCINPKDLPSPVISKMLSETLLNCRAGSNSSNQKPNVNTNATGMNTSPSSKKSADLFIDRVSRLYEEEVELYTNRPAINNINGNQSRHNHCGTSGSLQQQQQQQQQHPHPSQTEDFRARSDTQRTWSSSEAAMMYAVLKDKRKSYQQQHQQQQQHHNNNNNNQTSNSNQSDHSTAKAVVMPPPESYDPQKSSTSVQLPNNMLHNTATLQQRLLNNNHGTSSLHTSSSVDFNNNYHQQHHQLPHNHKSTTTFNNLATTTSLTTPISTTTTTITNLPSSHELIVDMSSIASNNHNGNSSYSSNINNNTRKTITVESILNSLSAVSNIHNNNHGIIKSSNQPIPPMSHQSSNQHTLALLARTPKYRSKLNPEIISPGLLSSTEHQHQQHHYQLPSTSTSAPPVNPENHQQQQSHHKLSTIGNLAASSSSPASTGSSSSSVIGYNKYLNGNHYSVAPITATTSSVASSSNKLLINIEK